MRCNAAGTATALLLALALLIGAGGGMAQAAPAHGIAMHGEPLYPPGFDHFAYVNPSAPRGGELRLSVTAAFDSLNPHTVKGLAAPGLAQTYETLMARSADEPFSLYGLIAESADMAPDRSAIEFILRKEARWHDGAPVTVEDVLFSWETLRRDGRPNTRLYYAKVAKAEQTGERALRFTFAPNADGAIDREMPLIMGLMPILNKKWWAGRDISRTFLDEAPLGSGPYRVATAEPGRRIVYQRVADYWGRDLPVRRGLYNVDSMVFTVYRDDRVALEAFLAGDADLRRENDPALWAAGYAGPAIDDGRIVMDELPHRRPQTIRGFVFNTRKPPFDDLRVRRALALLLDYDWIGRSFFHGKLTRSRSYFPNSELEAPAAPPQGDELALLTPFRDRLPAALFSEPPPTAMDWPDRRAAMREALRGLGEAGWKLTQGKLLDGAGRRMTFEILLNDPKDERVALEYLRALERIGVAAQLRTVDSAQFQARLNDFDFDTTMGGWESSLSPGNEQLYYYGSAAATNKGSRNLPGVVDPAVDALAAATARAATRAELVATVRALDRVLLWGSYVVPLLHAREDRIAHWRRLQRPAVTPLYGPPLETWWLE